MNANYLAVSILLGASACAGTQKPQEKLTLDILVERIMPSAVSLRATAVEVLLEIQNPMDKNVELTNISYSIDTKEVAGVLTGVVAGKKTVAAGKRLELTFRQEIPFPKDIEAYKAIMAQSTLPIELNGEITIHDGSKLSFSRISEIATPTLPKFVVHEAQAARYGKTGVDISLFLRLINENVFGLSVEGVDYTVELNGKEIKKEQAALGIKLLGSAAEEYEMTTILDDSTLGRKELKALLKEKIVRYRVYGVLELDFIKIPFDHSGEIKLAGK